MMQERAKKTRSRILESAVGLFSAQGFHGATIDEIAALADVNKQRIYAYFGSKSRLFEAALLDVFERIELFSHDTLARAEKHPEKITAIVLDGFLKVHKVHPELWRLLAWANLEGSLCTEALNQARRQENERLRRLYERAVGEGLLRPIPFKTWLFTLLAVTCFRFSNERTLVHTMDGIVSMQKMERKLATGLNTLFTPEKKSK